MTIELMRDFDATALVLSNLSATYFWSYAVVQVPAGLAVESMVKPLTKTRFDCPRSAVSSLW